MIYWSAQLEEYIYYKNYTVKNFNPIYLPKLPFYVFPLLVFFIFMNKIDPSVEVTLKI